MRALVCLRAPELVDGANTDGDLRPGESRSPFGNPAHQSKERRIGWRSVEDSRPRQIHSEPLKRGRPCLAWVLCRLLVFGALLCKFRRLLFFCVLVSAVLGRCQVEFASGCALCGCLLPPAFVLVLGVPSLSGELRFLCFLLLRVRRSFFLHVRRRVLLEFGDVLLRRRRCRFRSCRRWSEVERAATPSSPSSSSASTRSAS